MEIQPLETSDSRATEPEVKGISKRFKNIEQKHLNQLREHVWPEIYLCVKFDIR